MKSNSQYKALIKNLGFNKSKYDLLKDYIKVISSIEQTQVIKKLEEASQNKYILGDLQGSIRALRRSEKYY